MHPNQGCQYQMKHYHKSLKEKGILQLISKKENYCDSGIMENYFRKMKNEMFYGQKYEFEILQHLKEKIEEYIRYYNKKAQLLCKLGVKHYNKH